MKKIACINAVRKFSAPVLAFLLNTGLAGCSGGGNSDSAPPPESPPRATTYSLVNLGPDYTVELPEINLKGQVAFTVLEAGNLRGKFFNGDTTVDIATLGGASTIVRGLNDAGRVAGASTNASARYRAFLWSAAGGMAGLGTLGGAPGNEFSEAMAINHHDSVVGHSSSNAPFNPNHAFLWRQADGMIDLGTLGTMAGAGSIALAINDKEQIAGDFDAAMESIHAFLWTKATGMLDLGTLGGSDSFTVAINDLGEVAGNSSIANTPERILHAFVWNSASGMLDLGTLGGTESNASAINRAGQVVGIANTSNGNGHGFFWTRRGGMLDLGTLGGTLSRARAINNQTYVAGTAYTDSEVSHAFIWSTAGGMVDLNSRLRHAPKGLVLADAVAISDRGLIVASSNAGLVLLKPGMRGTPAPVLGPIIADEPVLVGVPAVLAVHFRDQDIGDVHSARWSWGDGSADTAGTLTETDGSGVATGRHIYTCAGTYPVSVTVSDSSGRSTTVGRNLVVEAVAGCT